MIRLEKEKLIKIIELARENESVDVEQLLDLVVDDSVEEKNGKNGYKIWNKEDENELIRLLESDMPYRDIAKKMNRKRTTLYTKAHELRRSGRLNDKSEFENNNQPYDKDETMVLLNVLQLFGEVKKIPDYYMDYLVDMLGRNKRALRVKLYSLQKEVDEDDRIRW